MLFLRSLFYSALIGIMVMPAVGGAQELTEEYNPSEAQQPVTTEGGASAQDTVPTQAEASPDADGHPDVSTSPMPLTMRSVNLRALNKVTAKTSYLDVPVGTAVRFGNLEVVARNCWKAPPEERPENAALLDIWETIPGEEAERVFYGWMFSSSPSLSALEHPVYDIIVVSCDARAYEPGA